MVEPSLLAIRMTEEKNLVETIVEQYIGFLKNIFSRLERLEKSAVEQNKYNITMLELVIKLHEKDVNLSDSDIKKLRELRTKVNSHG